jgi:cyclomaltodextrinase
MKQRATLSVSDPRIRYASRSTRHREFAMSFKLGRYRHYKGNEYEVLHLAKHSETEEKMVVYRALYGDRGIWVRPLAMFVEEVQRDGKRVARFKYIGDE